MSLLIFALVIILVLALALYAIDLIPLDTRLKRIVQAIAVVIAALVILSRAGLAG